MHLLAATPGRVDDGSEAVDLGQSPGDIVVLSAAESELACLAAAHRRQPLDAPTVRLASLLPLGHPMSVDLYLDSVIVHAKLVVVRVLGGRGYWPYGVEQVGIACREQGIPVAFLPGDDQPDPDLATSSSLSGDVAHRLWQYLVQGGEDNALGFLRYAGTLIGRDEAWREPVPLPPAGRWPTPVAEPGQPVAALIFYRSLVQAGNTGVIAALAEALAAEGLAVVALYATSLKDPLAAGVIAAALAENPPDVILNATGFAVSTPGGESAGPFLGQDCPVLQVVFSGGTEEAWREGSAGLSARDIAMSVALPEVDGRILARAVSFKARAERDARTEGDVVAYRPVPDRIAFTAQLAAAWVRLRRMPAGERRVALVLANYPTRDGRLGNGVGLDTPAATAEILKALKAAGYDTGEAPETGAALMALLQAGPTNAPGARVGGEVLQTVVVPPAVTERWGPPEADPHHREGGFALSLHRFGNISVGIQPARGYQIDPASSYHDPALIPPHGYFAFYAWIRRTFDAHAILHIGKHGTLEWLPGKSLALSADCYPEAVLGPLPHLYPFIVNDPGEGTQAKRRSQAVIIDHLTPPLARAETYGPLKDLEALVDEYYEASGVDPRRLGVLRGEILSLAQSLGLDRDVGIAPGDADADALAKLDNHLCELKEMQIRDGLHIFGQSPQGSLRTALLVALARVPGGGAISLHRALAADLGLGFDPLICILGDPWTGPRPAVLGPADGWRTAGDTVERLEALASQLVEDADPEAGAVIGPQTAAALAYVRNTLAPAIDACGPAEIAGVLAGLAGRFVAPGPSGAPTRGRPDVLPTGRNFYSVDTRVVPTPAAWTLGWASAQRLCERHAQDQGQWPTAMALTAWGTATMRTGGDDIAQGLALMGVKPTWDAASRRVTGFEILPAGLLDRPRVDVTLRISGFFRDAFPGLVDLFDSAARAVAALDEPDEVNPLAARVRQETASLRAAGVSAADAARQAGYRVFGSKPGAYGAGLQALIDERGWETAADLARAYVAWGGFAYGASAEGQSAHGLFERRLAAAEAVIQNQDNREHDILDSDDYYQFEGGMTAAVRELSGTQPAIWHGDHSRPENPVIRSLKEEIARVVRGRAANPKWIAGCRRHGYKGAFEMAATVDYLFAFAATARVVDDHHFDAVFDAYLGDESVRGFLAGANPRALEEIADRFAEAISRGLWRPRRNSVSDLLAALRTPP